MIRLNIILIGLVVPLFSLAQSLTLVDLNLRYDNPNDGVNAWSERKKTTLNWLKNQDADLYFFQEVLHHQYNELRTTLIDHQSYGIGREDGISKGEYSPIFFKTNRFELKDTLTIWLSPNPSLPSKGWDAACERIATLVILNDRLDNKILVCINTHWDHLGKIAQEKSADLINTLIEISPAQYQILGGDFNVTASHPGIKKLSERLNIVKAMENRDTYHGFKDEVTAENGPIDLILSSDALQATKYQYFRHSTEGIFLSDHDAIFVVWTKNNKD
jgi:endonuclease/exonuclease/phosphatase family metal-dependent hydrolase